MRGMLLPFLKTIDYSPDETLTPSSLVKRLMALRDGAGLMARKSYEDEYVSAMVNSEDGMHR